MVLATPMQGMMLALWQLQKLGSRQHVVQVSLAPLAHHAPMPML
jgi:hypothetical protein